jgi:DNA repair photolyase
LVDEMIEAGYYVHLIRAPVIPQYTDLKHAYDHHDTQ